MTSDLLDDISDLLGSAVQFPSVEAQHAAAVWSLHTHVFRAFESTPRLVLISAEKQSGKTRVLELLELLCRTRQIEERLAWGAVYASSDLVFTREDGRPIHPDRFSQMFERHVQSAGLRRIHLHDLRHTHAALALQAGVQPKVISERLGHATVAFTMYVYAQAIPAMQREAAERGVGLTGRVVNPTRVP